MLNLSKVIEFLLTVDLIAIPIGIILGIVYAIKARGEQDAIAKKTHEKNNVVFFLVPSQCF